MAGNSQDKNAQKPKPPSKETKAKQTPGYSEDDFLGALDKATERLDRRSSERGRGSPKRGASDRRDD